MNSRQILWNMYHQKTNVSIQLSSTLARSLLLNQRALYWQNDHDNHETRVASRQVHPNPLQNWDIFDEVECAIIMYPDAKRDRHHTRQWERRDPKLAVKSAPVLYWVPNRRSEKLSSASIGFANRWAIVVLHIRSQSTCASMEYSCELPTDCLHIFVDINFQLHIEYPIDQAEKESLSMSNNTFLVHLKMKLNKKSHA